MMIFVLGGSSHLVSGLVHPSYKWTNRPTYPIKKSPGSTNPPKRFVASSPPSTHRLFFFRILRFTMILGSSSPRSAWWFDPFVFFVFMGYDTTLNRLGDIGSNPQTSGIVEGDIMGIHGIEVECYLIIIEYSNTMIIWGGNAPKTAKNMGKTLQYGRSEETHYDVRHRILLPTFSRHQSIFGSPIQMGFGTPGAYWSVTSVETGVIWCFGCSWIGKHWKIWSELQRYVAM